MRMPEILSCKLPGHPASVAAARRWALGFLGLDPRADDALVIVSELATNAVLHSRSREEGGEFEVRLELAPDVLRIEVVDPGEAGPLAPSAPDEAFGPAEDPAFPYGESGRGLLIVYRLADDWGHKRRESSTLWWAELWAHRER
jgi:serine/threonine-protein kinase RsbW